jgi:uncharacterized membrane protein (UPF0127 family)
MAFPGRRFLSAIRTAGNSLCAIVGVAFLVACSAQAPAQTAVPEAVSTADQTAVHPTSGLQIIPVSVVSASGTHTFRTELANTAQAQARGLMFRTELGPDEAMLFPSQVPGIRSFWMKNVPIPLDIIFIGVDGRISNIAANTTPYSTQSVASVGAASAVLELAGGRAAELGITAGDAVEYSLD